MNDLELWMEGKKDIVRECDTLEDFNKKIGNHIYQGYVRLERCFWTAKNFPNTYLSRTLSYPKLLNATDFFREIHLHKKTTQTRREQIVCPTCGASRGERVVNPQPEPEGIFLHQDYSGKQINDLLNGKAAEKKHTMWSSFYCHMMPYVACNAGDMKHGGIEIIDRPDGWILIATDHINSDWLGIIKNWDITLNEDFCYERKVGKT